MENKTARQQFEEILDRELSKNGWDKVLNDFKKCELELTSKNIHFIASIRKHNPRITLNKVVLDNLRKLMNCIRNKNSLTAGEITEIIFENCIILTNWQVYRSFHDASVSYDKDAVYSKQEVSKIFLFASVKYALNCQKQKEKPPTVEAKIVKSSNLSDVFEEYFTEN